MSRSICKNIWKYFKLLMKTFNKHTIGVRSILIRKGIKSSLKKVIMAFEHLESLKIRPTPKKIPRFCGPFKGTQAIWFISILIKSNKILLLLSSYFLSFHGVDARLTLHHWLCTISELVGSC